LRLGDYLESLRLTCPSAIRRGRPDLLLDGIPNVKSFFVAVEPSEGHKLLEVYFNSRRINVRGNSDFFRTCFHIVKVHSDTRGGEFCGDSK
jgi:hypothetical protein